MLSIRAMCCDLERSSVSLFVVVRVAWSNDRTKRRWKCKNNWNEDLDVVDLVSLAPPTKLVHRPRCQPPLTSATAHDQQSTLACRYNGFESIPQSVTRTCPRSFVTKRTWCEFHNSTGDSLFRLVCLYGLTAARSCNQVPKSHVVQHLVRFASGKVFAHTTLCYLYCFVPWCVRMIWIWGPLRRRNAPLSAGQGASPPHGIPPTP